MADVKRQEKLPIEQQSIDALMQQHAGKGVSNKADDNLVPQISVLQSLSPEVLDGPGRVDGAKPGDFMIGDKLIAGKDGFWFQPCFQDHTWLEFTPLDRGGGFVAQHPFDLDAPDLVPPPGAMPYGKQKWRMESGNEVIHYRQLAGILWNKGVNTPYVISFKSTGHTVMRKWMTKAATSNQFPNGDQRALFAHVYHITSESKRSAQYQWFIINVGEPVLLGTKKADEIVADSMRAFMIGASLHDAFQKKEKQVEQRADQQQEAEIPF